ncbi:hypothetical protein D3C80_1097860 [compost metagenome]
MQCTGRYPGIGEAGEHRRWSGRGFLGALNDHRAASSQRRGNFAQDLADREVPGSETDGGADWHANGLLGDVAGAGRNHSPVGSTSLLGEPVDQIGSAVDFHAGFAQRFAFFNGNQRGDGFGALAHQTCGFAHQLATFEHRDCLPGLEPDLGGLQRFVQVGAAGMGKAADGGAGGGVDHLAPHAVAAVAPLAVDQQFHLWIVHDIS